MAACCATQQQGALSPRAKTHLWTSYFTVFIGLVLLIASIVAMGFKVDSDGEGVIALFGLCSTLLPPVFRGALTDICGEPMLEHAYMWRCPQRLLEFLELADFPPGVLPPLPKTATQGDADEFGDELLSSVGFVTLLPAVATIVVGAVGAFGAWRGMKVLLAVQLPCLVILTVTHTLTMLAPLAGSIGVLDACDCLEITVQNTLRNEAASAEISSLSVCSGFPHALRGVASIAAVAMVATLTGSITFCYIACDSLPMRGRPPTPKVSLGRSKYVHTRNPLDVMEANSSGL